MILPSSTLGTSVPSLPVASAARVTLAVSYLVSFQDSASATVLHAFQSVQPHRMALGAPIRRVLLLADDQTFQMRDFDSALQRCVGYSRIAEVALLPNHGAGLIAPSTTSAGGATQLAASPNDIDNLLHQSSPVDFARVLAAVFRSDATAGPPVLELDEGQPLAARVNCRPRSKQLRAAVVDGVSREALKAISEEHLRQLRAARSSQSHERQVHVSELNELYAEREQLRAALTAAQAAVLQVERQAREDRDSMRMHIGELAEQLRQARGEVTVQTLSRLGVPPDAERSPWHPYGRPPPTSAAFPAPGAHTLQRITADIASGAEFLAQMRSATPSTPRTPMGDRARPAGSPHDSHTSTRLYGLAPVPT